MCKCRNAGLFSIRSVWYWNEKNNDAGTGPVPKPRQSGIFLVQYRTEIIDAGMQMPALVSSMPMPSYGFYQGKVRDAWCSQEFEKVLDYI